MAAPLSVCMRLLPLVGAVTAVCAVAVARTSQLWHSLAAGIIAQRSVTRIAAACIGLQRRHAVVLLLRDACCFKQAAVPAAAAVSAACPPEGGLPLLLALAVAAATAPRGCSSINVRTCRARRSSRSSGRSSARLLCRRACRCCRCSQAKQPGSGRRQRVVESPQRLLCLKSGEA